jgi:uncharacterized protein DUF4062/SIR2-like protein
MSSQVRVFISSTMKDLANERAAVARQVEQFNFEPVNAENWLPDGSKTWDRIEKELLSSHLVVLILGESYGWIPPEGVGAGQGRSVTHMEATAARKAGIPILAFVKRLDYDSPRGTRNAKQRDAFLQEVQSWSGGLYTTDFGLAADLSVKVGAALVNVLSESYLKEQVRAQYTRAISLPPEPAARLEPLDPNPELMGLLREKRAVLLAGAGLSLSAGYPAAHALSELLIADAFQRGSKGLNLGLSGSIQEIAENFETAYGRPALLKLLQSALSPPLNVSPTPAQLEAVRLFRTVLTSNLDELLEAACREAGLDFEVITGDGEVPPPSDRRAIIKIAGSVSQPESVIITALDAWETRSKKPRLWLSLRELLDTNALVVVAHSLRDINVKALVKGRSRRLPGYIVGNEIGTFDALRFKQLGLEPIFTDAETFFRTYSQQ